MKHLVLAIFFLLTTEAFAWSAKYIDVEAGDVREVDLTGMPQTVSLRVTIQSPSGHTEPLAVVEESSANFKCEVDRTILLNSSFDQKTKLFTQQHEIRINWETRNRYSNCLVNIYHPSLPEGTAAIFYIGY